MSKRRVLTNLDYIELESKIDGKLQSNYDLWLSLGHEGTTKDFLEFLRGQSAYEIWASKEENAGKTEEEFIASLSGGSAVKDWNQNDETAADYIKNRTHWEEETYEYLINETNINIEGAFQELYNLFYVELINGDTCIVNFDGEEYTCVVKQPSKYELIIGNSSILGWYDNIDTGEPFFIYTYRNENLTFAFNVAGSHTISIKHKITVYHPLDERYIDESIIKKTGKNVTGREYTYWDNDANTEVTIISKQGAEIFNDYERNFAVGENSHAEGYFTKALGNNSHAEGRDTIASGDYSHAEGSGTETSGYNSHAEGYHSKAFNNHAHAEGEKTTASGIASHAEGYSTIASGDYSHAEGRLTKAIGVHSHAEGRNTKSSSENQHVQGRYNIEDTTGKYAHIVGNGEYSKDSNAHTLDWNGNAWYQGDVLVGGTSQDDASKLATETYVDTALANFSGGATDFNDMTATDTSGFLGTVNASVNAQTLMNDVMSRIAALEALAEELETI